MDFMESVIDDHTFFAMQKQIIQLEYKNADLQADIDRRIKREAERAEIADKSDADVGIASTLVLPANEVGRSIAKKESGI